MNDAFSMARALPRALRVKQWTKNAVVFAALVFALGERSEVAGLHDIPAAAMAALLFCLISSGVYLLNDVRDLEQDRQHPLKQYRPIAAGTLPVSTAVGLAVLLLGGGLASAWFLSPAFFAVAGGYVAMQFFYSMKLKEIPLVDIFVIAIGFVFRALAGAVAIQVPISPWLLLCTLLLALFLALCKRRHERVIEEDFNAATRPSLRHYDPKLLDQLIAIVSAATITSYSLYTLWPDTVDKFGSYRLGFTIPFVIFGLFRYLDLVYRHEHGGRPEQTLLTDGPLLADIALYGVSVLLLLFVF